MVPVRLLRPEEIGEGLFPVAVPVIRARAVEAVVDQGGEVFMVAHGVYWSENIVCPNYAQSHPESGMLNCKT